MSRKKPIIEPRIDLKVGFDCNNQCLFCVQGDKRERIKPRSGQKLVEILRQNAGKVKAVVFTGGEPTIRNDIVSLVKLAKSLGYTTIQIQTNGRRFCYLPFVKAIKEAGVTEISPALHGSTAEIHDQLTLAAGSFEQTVAGIKNGIKMGLKVITNSVVVKGNLTDLPKLAKLLVALKVDQLQFAFVHPLGTARKLFDQVVPRFSQARPFLHKALDITRAAGILTYTEAVPYCFMSDYEEHVVEEVIPDTRVIDKPTIIDDYTQYRLNQGKVKTEKCGQCKWNQKCEGPWREYPEHYGWDEFVPIEETFQTPDCDLCSFQYFCNGYPRSFSDIQETKPTPITTPIENCLVGNKVSLNHPELILRESNLLLKVDEQIFRLPAHPLFTNQKVRDIIQKGQVYLKNQPGPVKNFQTDLQRLTIQLTPAQENTFELEETILIRELKKIKGPILDVGSGDPFYLPLFKEKVASGDIQNHAVEPDLEKCQQLKDAEPNFQVNCLDFEQSEYPKEFFNFILVLRSWNHFNNIHQAIKLFKKYLKPDGTLLVVDNIPFILLEAKPETDDYLPANSIDDENLERFRSAKHGTQKGPEHFRNHHLKTAKRLLERYGFKVQPFYEVGFSTANQWFLQARK